MAQWARHGNPGIWQVLAANQLETFLLLPELLSVSAKLTWALPLTQAQTEMECPELGLRE